MADEPTPRSEPRWGRRLILLLTAALLVALPAAWVSSQYFGNEVNATLSFHADDGWCNWGYTPDFGKHCFGDYVNPLVGSQIDFQLRPAGEVSAAAIPGDTNPAYTSLYPPFAQFPHVAAALVAKSFLGRDVAFFGYVTFLALAVLTPALWVAWTWRRSPFSLIPLLLIGVASVPVFSTLDRGNSAGFVIPFVLAFALFLGRKPVWAAPAAVVAAAIVRPQFILLVLAFLAIRQWRQACAAVGTFAALTLASFAFMPSGFVPSLRAWLGSVSGLSSVGFGGVTSDTPANLSIARSVTALAGWFANGPWLVGDAGQWIHSTVIERPILPVMLLAVLTLGAFLSARGRVPRIIIVTVPIILAAGAPGFAPIYYLGFALVLAALVIEPGEAGRQPALDDAPRTWWMAAWGWLLTIAITLSLAPLTFAGTTPPGSPIMRNSVVLENVGRIWLVVVLAGLAVAVTAVINRRAARPRPDSEG